MVHLFVVNTTKTIAAINLRKQKSSPSRIWLRLPGDDEQLINCRLHQGMCFSELCKTPETKLLVTYLKPFSNTTKTHGWYHMGDWHGVPRIWFDAAIWSPYDLALNRFQKMENIVKGWYRMFEHGTGLSSGVEHGSCKKVNVGRLIAIMIDRCQHCRQNSLVSFLLCALGCDG